MSARKHHDGERLVRFIIIALLALSCFGAPAQAYGPTGHRVIAELAYGYLTPEARAAVDSILEDDFLAEVATLPDEMRSNPDEFWQVEANPYHYINVPPGQTYEESEKNPAGDAFAALEKYSAVLTDDTASLEDRKRALWFVVHIVGDLHQPLHVGYPGDRGGNWVDVVFMEELTNLHRLWDEHLIDHRDLSYTEWTRFLERKIKPEMITDWQKAQPIDWVHEGLELRDDIYANSTGILSWDYVYKYMPLIKSQLSKGGVRLGGYLNSLFK